MDVGNVFSKDVIYIKGVSGSGSGLNLRTGDIIQAKVISTLEGNVILRIGDTRIEARSNVPLKEGAIVSLAVTEVGSDRIALKHLINTIAAKTGLEYSKEDLVERFSEMAGITRTEAKDSILAIVSRLKGKQVDTGLVFKELAGQLEKHIATGKASADALNLSTALNKVLINSAGSDKIFADIRMIVDALQHENRVASSLLVRSDSSDSVRDLKSLLLDVRESIGSNKVLAATHIQEREIAGLLGSIEKAVQNLNAAGLANIPIHSNSENFFYIPVPIYCDGRICTAEIRIFEKGKDSSKDCTGEKSFTVGFSLQMPALGSTQAFLEIYDGTVSLSMAMENLDAVKIAGSMAGSLADSFESLGYRVGKISIVHMNNDEKNRAENKREPAAGLIKEKLGIRQEGVDVYG